MRNLQDEQQWLITGSLVTLTLLALAAAMAYASTVLVPFVLALFIYCVVAPPMDFLTVRWRVPKIVAMVVLFAVIVAGMLLMAMVLYGSVNQISDPEIQQKYTKAFDDLLSDGQEAVSRLTTNLGIENRPEGEDRPKFAAVLDSLPRVLQVAGGVALNLASTSFMMLIFVIFMLAGHQPHSSIPGPIAEIAAKVRRYVATKFFTSALTGLATAAVLSLFGVDFVLMFATLTFLLNFIPSIGSVIATILPLPIALASLSGPEVIGLMVVLTVVQNAVGNGLEPKMLGKGLELHPLAVLIGLGFWGMLWGGVGMLLSAPLTAAMRVALAQFETTKPAADLLAGQMTEKEA